MVAGGSDVAWFDGPAALRAWFEANHATAAEVFVGFHKVRTGKAGLRWSEAVDEALCFGWIDSVMRPIDEDRYALRYTPRKPGSRWSKVNLAKVERLLAEGRMAPAGIAAYESRRREEAGYSHEQAEAPELPPAWAAALEAEPFWAASPPWYRKAATNWVASAKKEETRQRRFDALLADSAAGRRVKHLAR